MKPFLSTSLVLVLLTVGCFTKPTPECAFLCGAGGECPDDYVCRADNWCKRSDVAVDFFCGPSTVVDASVDADMGIDADTTLDADTIPDANATPDADTTPDADPPDAAPVCGNGMVEGGELCDDGNMNSCGSCSIDCLTVQTPAPATGTITTIAAATLLDAETFTLDDGISTPVVFEFEKAGGVAGEAVDITVAVTTDDVKAAIIAAVNGFAGSLLITAGDGGVGAVTLTHTLNGSTANQPLSETVLDAGFVVTGMTGGVARDCAAGVGCVVADDCLSGSCTASVCD